MAVFWDNCGCMRARSCSRTRARRRWANAAGWLDAGPVLRPQNWLRVVHEPVTEAELARVRQSVERGQPFGGELWVRQTAKTLGLEATLRPPGRPRKPVPSKDPETGAGLLGEW